MMTRSIIRSVRIVLVAAACAGSLGVAAVSRAQVPGNSNTPGEMQDLNRRAAMQEIVKNQNEENEAYEAFRKVSSEDVDKKIKAGENFIGKYPKSTYAEQVEVVLTNAYYAKQDWPNFYASADKALALKPDDVDVLVTVGWVIPHIYNPQDPNAGKLLEKAETYEKEAIPDIATMPKPEGMGNSQFSDFKTQKANEAHSALGMIYFRRGDYADSVTEFQQSTQNTSTPDQTDLFVLATSLEKLNRHAQAAESYGRCGQIDGPLQQACKQGEAKAKQLSAQAK